MERTKTNKDILWAKTGGGTFHLRRNGKVRIIKKGQRFTAALEEIPVAFRDTVVPADGSRISQIQEKDLDIEVTKLDYYLESQGHGWYDVIDSKGKVINESKLRKAKAEELLDSLKK